MVSDASLLRSRSDSTKLPPLLLFAPAPCDAAASSSNIRSGPLDFQYVSDTYSAPSPLSFQPGCGSSTGKQIHAQYAHPLSTSIIITTTTTFAIAELRLFYPLASCQSIDHPCPFNHRSANGLESSGWKFEQNALAKGDDGIVTMRVGDGMRGE